jgi:hypothetical protein
MKIFFGHISFWGAVIASLLLALNIPISGWAYILFLLSNFASAYIMRDTTTPKAIVYQNYYFVVINIIGIARWLL